jgi:hypothetical protein
VTVVAVLVLITCYHPRSAKPEDSSLLSVSNGGSLHPPPLKIFSSRSAVYGAAGQHDVQAHGVDSGTHSKRVAINFFGLTRSLSLTHFSIERNLIAPIEEAGYVVRETQYATSHHPQGVSICLSQCPARGVIVRDAGLLLCIAEKTSSQPLHPQNISEEGGGTRSSAAWFCKTWLPTR